jgi:hypothetical protein
MKIPAPEYFCQRWNTRLWHDGKVVLDCLRRKEPVLYAVSYNTTNTRASFFLHAGYAALIVFYFQL